MDVYVGKLLDLLVKSGVPVPSAMLVATDGEDGMPLRPGGLLLGHVVFKGMQFGSVLGTLVGALGRLRMPNLPLVTISSLWAIRGALVVGALIPVKLLRMPLTDEGVIDRGYRIAHNEKVVFSDCIGSVTACIGFVATGCKFGGAALGMALGVASCPLLWKGYTPGGWANR